MIIAAACTKWLFEMPRTIGPRPSHTLKRRRKLATAQMRPKTMEKKVNMAFP